MASPRGFFTWLDMRGLATLGAIRAHHVSTYIETLTHSYSGPSQAAPRRDPPAVRLADRRPADPNERELISDPRDRVMRSRFASRTSMSLVSSDFARFRVQAIDIFCGGSAVVPAFEARLLAGVPAPPDRAQHLDISRMRGAGEMTTYRFNTGTAQHTFCRSCGIHAFYVPRSDPDKYSVNARCLDDFDPATMQSVRLFDGRNWEAAFAEREGRRTAGA
jgi:hypothetical protein